MSRNPTRARPGAPAQGDAPTTPSGEAPASPTPPPEPPTVDPRVAELEASLKAAHESYERQLADLRAELSAARAAERPRRAVADSRLRINGVKLIPGDPIPEGTDLTKLAAGTWRYEEA